MLGKGQEIIINSQRPRLIGISFYHMHPLIADPKRTFVCFDILNTIPFQKWFISLTGDLNFSLFEYKRPQLKGRSIYIYILVKWSQASQWGKINKLHKM